MRTETLVRVLGPGFGPAFLSGLPTFQFQLSRVYALTIDAPTKCADECDAEYARAS